MNSFPLLAAHLLLLIITFPATSQALSGSNFKLSNLIIDSPFQRDPLSTSNTTVTFILVDPDSSTCTKCHIEWAVGLPPPSTRMSPSQPYFCNDPRTSVSFPGGTYNGTYNFILALGHTYQDDSIDEYPYNWATKFGNLNLTFPLTPDYGCDVHSAHCESRPGSEIEVVITSIVS